MSTVHKFRMLNRPTFKVLQGSQTFRVQCLSYRKIYSKKNSSCEKCFAALAIILLK